MDEFMCWQKGDAETDKVKVIASMAEDAAREYAELFGTDWRENVVHVEKDGRVETFMVEIVMEPSIEVRRLSGAELSALIEKPQPETEG